ncbi:hypothetical protein BGX24_003281, partial [Mortierella sp. AD032]
TINISNAPNVDEAELAKMTIPKLRSKNSSTISAKETDFSNNTNPMAATSDNSSSTSSSSKKKQTPEAKPRQKKKRKRKPRKPKSDVALLKSGFSKSFAISIQTLGSVEGCLQRALLPASECGRMPHISNNDIKAMATRIRAAVDTMAETDTVGPKTIKEKSKAAKEMALDAFARLRQILSEFQPVNKDSICVGRLIVDAEESSVQLRKHFSDFPLTIGQRYILL